MNALPDIGTLSIDPRLARVVFWIAVACCAVAQAAIVWSALKRPQVEGGPGGATVPQPRRASELAWTLVPAAMLAAVLGATWQVLAR